MSKATQTYIAGNPQPDEVFMVYGSKFFQAIKSYKATYEGQAYKVFNSITDPNKFNCIGFKDYVIGNSRS